MSARPYNGYHIKPTPEDDTLLTRVGPGTPCGEYMRRYWHPFLLSSELRDLPLPVRLLGEDLVVFRDGARRLGLLHRHCSHRGASLEFGIVAERGIRCCYHGWHYDVDGTILETPAEPTDRIKDSVSHGAYPVHEAHGLIFAYMGPPEALPRFPVYDTMQYPADSRIVPFRLTHPCNWLQIVENGCDPMHNSFLHAIVAQQFSAAFKVLPQLDYPETPLGFLTVSTRKVNDFVFIRANDVILPNVGQFPTGGKEVASETFGVRPYITRWAVPVDDENAYHIGFAYLNSYTGASRSLSPDDYGVDKFPFVGQTADRPYEERQRQPGDFDAVTTQGKIANRTAEHLATSDRGVAMVRRMIAKGISEVQAGKSPTVPPPVPPAGAVRTYVHEIIVRTNDPSLDDPKALSEFGRRAAAAFVETDQLPPEERDRVAEARIRNLVQREPVS